MLYKNIFPQSFPFPSNCLPFTMMFLEDWKLVTLNGVDSIKYLHSQFTNDIINQEVNQYNFAAHCNFKGKVLSNVCVFFFNKKISFITRRNVCDKQVFELKKYAIFSKTSISVDDKVILVGISGYNARLRLNSIFSILPNRLQTIIHYKNISILYFHLPIERFLLVTTEKFLDFLLKKMKTISLLNNSIQWLSLDIEAGYPLIDFATSEKFVPQATNIQLMKGIDFNKGCYLGQEIIARIQYKDSNKFSLYWLIGKSDILPIPGDNLEYFTNENWNRTGTVLASCYLNNGNVSIQAILNKHIVINKKFRVKQDNNSFLTIQPLLYVF